MAVQFTLFNFANYSPSVAMELKVSKEIKQHNFSTLKLHVYLADHLEIVPPQPYNVCS